MTNFSTNADPNVTERLRSRRARSGDAAAVFTSMIRKKTLNARRGTPDSGIRSAMVCAPAAQSATSTTAPFAFASADRADDNRYSGARAPH